MNPYWENGITALYQADARQLPLPDQSVQMICTSPPYFQQRRYEGQDERYLGSESTTEEYVANLVGVGRECWRVLRDDGVFWLNLDDSMGNPKGFRPGSGRADGVVDERGQRNRNGGGGGNLLGIPWRVALALQADGWILRQDVIWSKSNPMPESVSG